MIRPATQADEAAIAALHWASWRANYRAILPVDYIDAGLGDDLAAQWRARFAADPAPSLILVDAGPDGLDGFVAGFADAGTLYIDNLHAAPDRRGQGIGRRLIAAVARRAQAAGLQGAHLWVFDGNTPAFRFYARLGGVMTARQVEATFGHDAAETRFDWPDLATLVAAG
jgi:ribosomal protein S18 acetylase RimI-like enzyme